MDPLRSLMTQQVASGRERAAASGSERQRAAESGREQRRAAESVERRRGPDWTDSLKISIAYRHMISTRSAWVGQVGPLTEFWRDEFRILNSSHKGQRWSTRQSKLKVGEGAAAASACMTDCLPVPGRGECRMELVGGRRCGSWSRRERRHGGGPAACSAALLRSAGLSRETTRPGTLWRALGRSVSSSSREQRETGSLGRQSFRGDLSLRRGWRWRAGRVEVG